jgi:hypothetical protein
VTTLWSHQTQEEDLKEIGNLRVGEEVEVVFETSEMSYKKMKETDKLVHGQQ